MKGALGALGLMLALLGLLAWTAGRFGLGAGLTTLAVLAFIPVWIRGPRRIAVGALLHLLIRCALVLGILVCINILIANRNLEWDLTAGQRQSLSLLTVRQLQALPQPVEILAVASNPSEMSETLRRLSDASPNLRYRILNPVLDHFELNQLAGETGLASIEDGTVIFRTIIDQKPRVTAIQTFEEGEFAFDEQRWINAMIQITRSAPPRAYLCIDHGERDPARELVLARSLFDDLVFDVDFGSLRTMPPETDLLVVAGPRRDFDDVDIALLDEHMARGGAVLLLLDPPTPQRQANTALMVPLTRLENWVEANGIDLPDGIVAEDESSSSDGGAFGINRGVSPLVWLANSDHPVTESLNPNITPLLLSVARPLEVGEGDGLEERDMESLLQTNPRHTWISQSRQPLPEAGTANRQSLCVAAAVTRHSSSGAGSSRLVIIGDSDWLTDPLMQIPVLGEGGERLLRGAVGWLVQQEDLIAIPPRTPPATPIVLTPQQQRLASAFAVVLIPELLLALGVAQLISRNREEERRRGSARLWGMLGAALGLSAPLVIGPLGHPIIGAGLLAGSLLALALLWLQPDFERGRILASRALILGGVALGILLSALAFRGGTSNAVSVHPLSVACLSHLSRPVRVHAIGTQSNDFQPLLERLSQCTPLLTWDVLDPISDSARINALMEEHTVGLGVGQALIVGGDGLTQGTITRKVIREGDDEERWVNAIGLIGDRTPGRVHLTSGHGERTLDECRLSLRLWLDQLALLTESGPLTEARSSDIIIIAGPTEDFSPAEIEVLDRHIEAGGGVLALIDPPTALQVRNPGEALGPTNLTNLIRWLETQWAISLPPAIVIDDDPALEEAGLTSFTMPVTTFDQSHPVTRGLWQLIAQSQAPLVLHEIQPTLIDPTRLRADIDSRAIMATRSSTWAETDIESMLERGIRSTSPKERQSLPIAVAAQMHRGDRTARLVVIGDSDFVTDETLATLEGVGIPMVTAQKLLRDSLGWLTAENRSVFFADPAARVTLESDPHSSARRARMVAALIPTLLLLAGGLAASLWARGVPPGGRRPAFALVLFAGLALVSIPMVNRPIAADTVSETDHIFDFPVAQASRIVLTRSTGALSIHRTGMQWLLNDSDPASTDAVELLLRVLGTRGRTSQQAIAAGLDLAMVGLDPPQASVTLETDGGESVTLLLGPLPANSHRRVWAMIAGEDEVFTVDHAILTLVERAPERWEVNP